MALTWIASLLLICCCITDLVSSTAAISSSAAAASSKGKKSPTYRRMKFTHISYGPCNDRLKNPYIEVEERTTQEIAKRPKKKNKGGKKNKGKTDNKIQPVKYWEDPKNPGCYIMNVALNKDKTKMKPGWGEFNFQDSYFLSEFKIGGGRGKDDKNNEGDDVEAKLTEKRRSRLEKKEKKTKDDASTGATKWFENLEACEYTDKELADNGGEPPACGGLGSCLYCGHKCSEGEDAVEESGTKASLSIVKSKRRRGRNGEKLGCDGSIREGDRFFRIRYCPPTEQEILNYLNMTREEWDEIYDDYGEYIRTKMFVFHEPSDGESTELSSAVSSPIMNKYTKRQRWLQKLHDGDLSNVKTGRMKWYFMEGYKNQHAIACVNFKGNLRRADDDDENDEEEAEDTQENRRH